jgi:hypothetical protein
MLQLVMGAVAAITNHHHAFYSVPFQFVYCTFTALLRTFFLSSFTPKAWESRLTDLTCNKRHSLTARKEYGFTSPLSTAQPLAVCSYNQPVKVKLSLVFKHYAMKTYGGVEV